MQIHVQPSDLEQKLNYRECIDWKESFFQVQAIVETHHKAKNLTTLDKPPDTPVPSISITAAPSSTFSPEQDNTNTTKEHP